MITELTHKYLNGETTADEERQLLQLLEDETCPTAEQKALVLMLKASPVARDATWMEEDESTLYDAILQDRHNASSHHRIWPWISIAAMIVIAFGVGVSLSGDRQKDAVAYVYGREVNNKSEVLDMMESTMADFMASAESDQVELQLNEFFGK